jgi:hypothetical protein
MFKLIIYNNSKLVLDKSFNTIDEMSDAMLAIRELALLYDYKDYGKIKLVNSKPNFHKNKSRITQKHYLNKKLIRKLTMTIEES